jgi:hypothetical protein
MRYGELCTFEAGHLQWRAAASLSHDDMLRLTQSVRVGNLFCSGKGVGSYDFGR